MAGEGGGMDEVRIAVVGTGLVGRRHVEAIARTRGTRLACTVEPSDDGYAAALGVPCHRGIEAMLGTPGIDAVILATPTPLHAAQGIACVGAGLPVLVEKPIAVTAAEGRALVEAGEAAGVPVLVGHHRRHNPIVRRAAEMIGDGAIGAIRAVQATCWLGKPDGYFEEAPWRTREGAGPVSVNLVHDVDLLRHLCGEVTSVQAQAAPSARGHENEDVAAALLRFASGALGTISVSDAVPAPWSWELTSGEHPIYARTSQSCYLIGGSLGSLSLPDLTLWRHDGEAGWWGPISATVAPRPARDPLEAQIAHLADVARGNAAPLVSGREGLGTLEVIEAIQTAARTGGEVRPGGGPAGNDTL